MHMHTTPILSRLSALTTAMLMASATHAANTPEVEPNDSKATAQLVPMACGDTITGNTTGTSTTVPGAASADNFLIRTTATGSLSEYTLTMTSGTALPGQTLTIRGLNQTAGVPTAGSDAVVITAVTLGTTKVARWYGTGPAGANQDIIVRVTGTTSTTTDYMLTLTCATVTPTAMSGGSLTPGNVGVSPDAGTATALDTDWWVYDGNLNAVPTFGHDDVDNTVITRSLPAGTYYIALSNYNLCNNLGSPSDDTFRTGIVLDFPNVVADSSTTSYATVNATATDGVITLTGNGSRTVPLEIVWFSFVVAPPTIPLGSGAATPSSAQITTSTLLTVTVSPAVNPPSTGITVTGNLSSINGAAAQPFYDDGTHGDAAAGDNVFSYLASLNEPLTAGPANVPFTVADAQGRSSSNSISFTLTAAPTGSCCTNGGCTVTTAYSCGQGGGSYNGNGTNCGVPSYAVSTSSGTFTSISGTGTPAATAGGCDDCAQSVTLPFPFTLFDNSYGSVFVHSNGYLDFETNAVVVFTNSAIPSAATPNNCIYPLWDDLNPGVAGDIYYQTDGTAPNRTFTVEWTNVTQFALTTSENFQVILYEGSNNIEFRYGNITPETPAGDYTVGVENINGTIAYSIPGAELGGGSTARLWTYVPGTNPCTPACDSADFDCDGDVGTDFDIQAFFACLAGNCPQPPCTNSADFNHDGDTGTDSDIESFFRVLAGGPC
jgi:hypothetical protein